ncbi:hypothetical protein Trydic_g2945 [Trypoxylus dichotomus]
MLAGSENLTDRITREAIEIEKRPANLNKRDDSQRFPTIWSTVLTKQREQVIRQSTDPTKDAKPYPDWPNASSNHDRESASEHTDTSSATDTVRRSLRKR